MNNDRPHILIVGGGVIGLSTAISLLDHPVSPCNVTMIAADLPSFDPKKYSPNSPQAAPSSYASAWAGAHHVSDAKDERQLKWDKQTFDVFQKLEKKCSFGVAEQQEDGHAPALIWVHQTEYWQDRDSVNEKAIEWYPDYRPLSSSDLPKGVSYGCTLTTYDIVVPQYLPRLYQMFLRLGGRSLCRKVSSIEEAISLAQSSTIDFTSISGDQLSSSTSQWAKPSAVVVSPGLGALTLLGDKGVHPVRGQTVLVKAPWSTTTRNRETSWVSNSPLPCPPTWPGMSKVNGQGFRDMYILPRGDGTFIVGGTRLPDDWDTLPRKETTQEILERALSFMPTLAKSDQGAKPEVEQVDVIGVNVGLRPARREGVRLERGDNVDQIPVVYSYGYGGTGYQCSWGAAFETRSLIDEALGRPCLQPHSTIASIE